ncbi:MAG: thioredoxin family protein [Ktedonobacterales bacterium]|nr:thioredoxin family protein [Ktedonobacterales bacterium]
MMDVLWRGGVIVALGVVTWLVVAGGRAFVGGRQRRALAAPPLLDGGTNGLVRILAFSSDTCRQCHTHQWPAVQRVLAQRVGRIVVEEVDAPSHPDLAERYRILTVPSTVVLDGDGQVRAVNYGFANTQKLLEQVDALIKGAMTAEMATRA